MLPTQILRVLSIWMHYFTPKTARIHTNIHVQTEYTTFLTLQFCTRDLTLHHYHHHQLIMALCSWKVSVFYVARSSISSNIYRSPPPPFCFCLVKNSEKLPKFGQHWIQMGTPHPSEKSALRAITFLKGFGFHTIQSSFLTVTTSPRAGSNAAAERCPTPRRATSTDVCCPPPVDTAGRRVLCGEQGCSALPFEVGTYGNLQRDWLCATMVVMIVLWHLVRLVW